ncbi:DUF883 domain-containing protein [Methylomonas sp. LL1]|uniref:DUF883 domain-containing protein n=1 Tax=Methylomonas sp. LL1 TaxID=2785785 RepID=UPI0018C3C8E5|nr:DUF883 domain-containing protein [Methylomonas sp. LL1]QPK64404.1 DUF883 domain-containing protein [Methylomonas sp. LL1]CAG1022237.1 hypothetical protein MTYM_01575 [Methylococcales bacterium]
METVEKASNFAHESVDKIARVSNQAADALEEKGQQLKSAEQRLMKNCQGYVRDNPVSSLGIAVAAGFILSRLLSSR